MPIKTISKIFKTIEILDKIEEASTIGGKKLPSWIELYKISELQYSIHTGTIASRNVAQIGYLTSKTELF